jgi:hypothetical protein
MSSSSKVRKDGVALSELINLFNPSHDLLKRHGFLPTVRVDGELSKPHTITFSHGGVLCLSVRLEMGRKFNLVKKSGGGRHKSKKLSHFRIFISLNCRQMIPPLPVVYTHLEWCLDLPDLVSVTKLYALLNNFDNNAKNTISGSMIEIMNSAGLGKTVDMINNHEFDITGTFDISAVQFVESLWLLNDDDVREKIIVMLSRTIRGKIFPFILRSTTQLYDVLRSLKFATILPPLLFIVVHYCFPIPQTNYNEPFRSIFK